MVFLLQPISAYFFIFFSSERIVGFRNYFLAPRRPSELGGHRDWSGRDCKTFTLPLRTDREEEGVMGRLVIQDGWFADSWRKLKCSRKETSALIFRNLR